MRHYRVTIALLLFALGVAGIAQAEPHDPLKSGEVPRYVFFNRTDSASITPVPLTAEYCRHVMQSIGVKGNASMRVGISVIFNILEDDGPQLGQALRDTLAVAESEEVPIHIILDGENWWRTRLDLWNWWNPKWPGYDPRNRENVEWTDWDPEHAVKVCWRNWGVQFRVCPQPNIASPKFLEEHVKRYDILIPIIRRWYDSLPKDRKYLFGGVRVGWEASIGWNYYYYPDGNRLFEENPGPPLASIPGPGDLMFKTDPSYASGSTDWHCGVAKLGYAAATSSGLRHEGEITLGDHERLVHTYLEWMAKQVVKRGIPAHLVFVHQGGNAPGDDAHYGYGVAINRYSIPGYSFYYDDGPRLDGLKRALNANKRQQWMAAEYGIRTTGSQDWARRIQANLEYRQCRGLVFYNWESFEADPASIADVSAALKAITADAVPAR